ncbi:MAG: hypothetical protein PVJ66_09280 [Gammaproteobacteria bacterium]
MNRYRLYWILLLLTLTVYAGVGWSEQQLAGGWIDGFDGPAEAYTLERGGEAIAVAVYLPVYVGDRIQAAEGHVLKIGKSDGTVLSIDHSIGIFTIEEADQPATALGNFLQWAGSWFERYVDSTQTDSMVSSMVSRGEKGPPISMSLFPTGQARMLAGNRTIALYWDGGEPPFGLVLRGREASDPLLKVDGIDQGRTSIGPLDFQVGTYYLEVSDTDEVEIVRIDVVTDDSFPARPAEMQDAGMPNEVLNNLEAMWLAGQGDGEWVLEGYQRVADSRNEQTAARLLRQALEEGIAPTP